LKSDAKLFGFNTGRASIPATAQGRAKVEVIDHGTPLRFRVKLAGVNNLLMAHIHIAPDPVEITEPAGPIAYWFTGGPLPVTNLTEQVDQIHPRLAVAWHAPAFHPGEPNRCNYTLACAASRTQIGNM